MRIRSCAPSAGATCTSASTARRRGVRLLATPSTCAQFLPHSNEFAVDGRPPAYRRLTLQPDGTLDTEVVWVDEAAGVLDSASGAWPSLAWTGPAS